MTPYIAKTFSTNTRNSPPTKTLRQNKIPTNIRN